MIFVHCVEQQVWNVCTITERNMTQTIKVTPEASLHLFNNPSITQRYCSWRKIPRIGSGIPLKIYFLR